MATPLLLFLSPPTKQKLRLKRMGNISDLCAILALATVFAMRIWDTSLVDGSESIDGVRYAPESMLLCLGLGLLWIRLLLNILGEFNASAVLIQVMKEIVTRDIARFAWIILAILFGFAVAASALYTSEQCFDEFGDAILHEDSSTNRFDFTIDSLSSQEQKTVEKGHKLVRCRLKQEHFIYDFLLRQFLWPIVAIDETGLGFTAVNAGLRPIVGGVFMFIFGVVFNLVMLNLLIALMSSTYEVWSNNSCTN